MNRSNNKVALVTGSGRDRIGNVIARALADDGFDIALHYHKSGESAAVTVADLQESGISCQAFQADVAVQADVDQMFDSVQEAFGCLDVLVTTASIWESIPLEQVSADDVLRNFNVNTLGTFLCARRAGLQMTSQDVGGSIITMGDWAISRPYLDHSAYFVSKGAIPALTRTLAVELAHRNPRVRINCIHPGPVMYPPGCTAEEEQEMRDSTLVKQGNDPQVVVQAVKFFIENEFVTGTCLPVDGGRSIYAGQESIRQRSI